MRIGLIARADNRGLGSQTHAFYRNVHPARTLVIDGTHISPFTQHLSRYPDGIIAPFDGHRLDEDLMRAFLSDLDVVYTAETPYDYRFYDMARALGVKTVCHANPEFYRHDTDPSLPRPDAIWLPSSWLAPMFPGATVLPFPVDRTHFPYRPRTSASTFLHVVGRRATRDRNGTALVYKAFRRIRRPARLIIRSQDPVPRYGLARHVSLDIRQADILDSADLYTEGDILVFPRRFGGLCLPLNEALSSGIPVLMTDCSPQSSFLPPEMLVRSRPGPALRAQSGLLPTYDAIPERLAMRVEQLIDDPEEVARLSKTADALAESISWPVMLPRYLAALEDVCAR